MQFQMLDLILGGIMIISGLLAVMRGFTREVLSLVAWAAAAAAALAAVVSPEAKALASQYIQPEIAATIALGAGVFLIVLIVVSLISIRISDLVLDSRTGAFDRTLGLVYGLARGLVLVVVVYLGYIWLTPAEKRFEWVRTAVSLEYIEKAGKLFVSFLPDNVAETFNGKFHSDTNPPPATNGNGGGDETPKAGTYKSDNRKRLDQIIESNQGKKSSSPAFGGQN